MLKRPPIAAAPMTDPTGDHSQRVREQLERILSSAMFAGSERHRRFLSFVVEQALKGDTDKLNEFVLGFEVFNKNDSFDPRIDSIVRVEARRLRERLKKYYQEEGQRDPIIITLRPRSFVPVFAEVGAAPAVEAASPAPAAKRLRDWAPSHKMLAIVAGALLCGAAGTAILLSYWGKRIVAPPQTASILILPFQTLSGQESMGDGVTDSLITGLAGIPGLRVISRGSGIQLQQSGSSPYRTAADLNIDYLVEGTIQSRSGKIVVSAKMTETHSQSYVWAETRESTLEALPALERDMAGAIASRIRMPKPLPGSERPERRRAANPEAYSAFLKGQYHWYQWDKGGLEKSIAFFEQAIQGDPNYAPAWAWLAQSYHILAVRDDGRDPAIIAKGRQAARKALALDDQLAEAYAAEGSFAALDWDWTGAERNFRRAIELNPDWAHGHLLYALWYLLPMDRGREALGEAFRARELDPLTQITRFLGTEVLYLNRDFPRALAEAEDLRKPATGPSPLDRVYYLSMSQLGKGKRALAELRQATQPPDDVSPGAALFGYLLAQQGETQQARAIRNRLLRPSGQNYVSPILIATVSAGLGDKDEAFRQLRLAVSHHVPGICQMRVDPVFDSLRSDPRYNDILRAIGLKP
jgi:TolB-like protein